MTMILLIITVVIIIINNNDNMFLCFLVYLMHLCNYGFDPPNLGIWPRWIQANSIVMITN